MRGKRRERKREIVCKCIWVKERYRDKERERKTESKKERSLKGQKKGWTE